MLKDPRSIQVLLLTWLSFKYIYTVLICLNSFVDSWKPDRVNFVPDTVMGTKFTLHFRVWYSTHSMGYFQAEVAIIFKLPTQVWNLYSLLFALHPIFGKISVICFKCVNLLSPSNCGSHIKQTFYWLQSMNMILIWQ